jgi:hypothetical protein
VADHPLRRLGILFALVLAVCMAGTLAWAAWTPVAYVSRDELFEIPKGTWARRMAGDKAEILPSEVRLMLGVRDVLLLKNLDDVPQIFGPTLIMPGQSFRLPFDVASSYQFACSAHASGQMSVVVVPQAQGAGDRLRWRAEAVRALIKNKFP